MNCYECGDAIPNPKVNQRFCRQQCQVRGFRRRSGTVTYNCRTCGDYVPLGRVGYCSDEHKQSADADGKKAWKAARRAWIAEVKSEVGCIDCGYNEAPEALDFDHLPEFEKRFGIAQGCTNYSIETVQEEMDKCEVVCANCHRIRTKERAN